MSDEAKVREPSEYRVYEVVDRPRPAADAETGEEVTTGGAETLKLVGTVAAISSADAERQWRAKLAQEFRGGRSGEVEFRCIAARYADPLYFAYGRQEMVVEGGAR